MIPLNRSIINEKNQITDSYKSEQRNENKFLRKLLQLISSFLILILIDKLDKLIKSKSKIVFKKNTSENPIFIKNNYSTLKNQYFTRFENIFTKSRKETELSDSDKIKFKQYILIGYSSLFKKEYKKIDTIIFNKKMNFGNAIFIINNLIYFCEILGCKKIYLWKDYWFVKKPIYDKELDITISPFTINVWDNQTSVYINSNMKFTQITKLFGNHFIPVRTYILKNELFSNIKLINTNIEDLYINIRSGKDIFRKHKHKHGNYIQPPLCFYQTIITMFNFSKIYIISNGKENPVVNELLKSYNNIKYFHGKVQEDLSIILGAKNLVLPCSSFSVELIKLSDNLKNLFEFNLSKNRNFWHFNNRHLKPLKFNRFIMNPTKEYIEVMKPWKSSKEQLSQMIKEKCFKKFKIVPSDFV
jgi:hypothetical protein